MGARQHEEVNMRAMLRALFTLLVRIAKRWAAPGAGPKVACG
jgi:hypothetical protein